MASMAVYTPAKLAEKWGCSERTVRNIVARGGLRAFRVGDKLLRIPAEAVEEYECRNIVSSVTGDDGPSAMSIAPASDEGFRSAQVTRLKLRARSPRS